MTTAPEARTRTPSVIHRWIRRGFVAWAVVSTLWLANSFRTQGVDVRTLHSSAELSVVDRAETLEFVPAATNRGTALIFICGSGVAADAYAPLLRPIGDAGFPVFVVKLPYRFAPFDSHKQTAVDNVHGVIASHPEYPRWVVAGHSLGGALACRVTQSDPAGVSALVLIGTTHPKLDDLSRLSIAVTKVYATNDGIAPVEHVLANSGLLPKQTKWVKIEGGNHSQFGHYGHQVFDGSASISRQEQQSLTRAALLETLAGVEKN